MSVDHIDRHLKKLCKQPCPRSWNVQIKTERTSFVILTLMTHPVIWTLIYQGEQSYYFRFLSLIYYFLLISQNKCIHSLLLNFRSPTPTFTNAVDNFTKQQFNYTLELRSTIESTIESYMDQNYTLYSVYWSQMAMSHNRILFRINIWTYSFLLKLVPSIILTVITGFLIKGIAVQVIYNLNLKVNTTV